MTFGKREWGRRRGKEGQASSDIFSDDAIYERGLRIMLMQIETSQSILIIQTCRVFKFHLMMFHRSRQQKRETLHF